MSIILSTATRYLLPLLLLLSIFLFLRGHNQPGGGFVGGLIAAAAFALYAIATSTSSALQLLRIDTRTLLGIGLALALASGLVAVLSRQPFLAGLWGTIALPVVGKLGTPVLFDLGVYLAVLGVTLTILFSLMEE
jgi:multicomponent Na+:H+ antiporter subunit B